MRKWIAVFLCVMPAVMPSLARAEGFIAALAGPAIVTSASSGNHFSFGGRVGFSIYESYNKEGQLREVGSLGVAVSSLSDSASISGISADVAITFIGVEYVGRKMWGTGLYMGARMGIGLTSTKISNGGNHIRISTTDFASAPVLGYEVALGGSGVRLFLDASWAMVWKQYGEKPAAVLLHAGLGTSF